MLENSDLNQICSFLASRIRAERLRNGLTQEQMSKKSGIPLRTYKRFETSGFGSMGNLIKLLKAFDRLRILELLFPSPAASHQSIIARFQQIKTAMGKK